MPENENLNRRNFLKWIGTAGAGVVLTGCGKNLSTELHDTGISKATVLPTPTEIAEEIPGETAVPQNPTDAILAVVRGNDPAAMTQRALAAVGGWSSLYAKARM